MLGLRKPPDLGLIVRSSARYHSNDMNTKIIMPTCACRYYPSTNSRRRQRRKAKLQFWPIARATATKTTALRPIDPDEEWEEGGEKGEETNLVKKPKEWPLGSGTKGGCMGERR